MKLNKLSQVYFCTGARNNELLDYFNPENLSFEIDERTASFKALGRAKISSEPIAICTTSGTAVSECLSALIEAYYSNVPLLLITGDRPKRMHGKACPQTIDHESITRGARKSYVEVELEELHKLDLTTLSFPAHINVLIEKKNERPKFTPKTYAASWDGFETFIKENPRPLILIGHETSPMGDFVDKISTLGLPVYAEILSGAHTKSTMAYEKDLLRALKNGEFSSVIRIGHTPMTKMWRLLEETPLPQFSFDERGFLGLSHGTVLPLSTLKLMDEVDFWETLKKCIPFSIKATEPSRLQELMRKYPQSDIAQISQLEANFESGSIVYLGNSLVIRFYELINNRNFNFFGNRGVNGIDGQLSTAIGLASGTKEIVYCILGDLTTLYDLSAIKDIPENLKLIIINNSGGRIFETMKLNEKLILKHETQFEKIASAFNIPYALNNYKALNDVKILELITNPTETMSFLKEWEQ
jgi:2-succinyl-5-enolpyruvyl-6-hydroxy-3-cyclohexene-1-carboxylate synthase